MVEIPRTFQLRSALALLAWLTLTIGLTAIGFREQYERQHFLAAIEEAAKTSSDYDIGPNPYDRPERMSFAHLNPYLLAAIGVAGAITLVVMLAKDSERTMWLLGAAFLWEAFPTACWLYSFWDGRSDFFSAAEIAALVVAPIAAGIVHRSWKVAAASTSLPVIACGVMWAGFILLMGNGR